MVWIGLIYALVVVIGLSVLIGAVYLYVACSLAFAAYVVRGEVGLRGARPLTGACARALVADLRRDAALLVIAGIAASACPRCSLRRSTAAR